MNKMTLEMHKIPENSHWSLRSSVAEPAWGLMRISSPGLDETKHSEMIMNPNYFHGEQKSMALFICEFLIVSSHAVPSSEEPIVFLDMFTHKLLSCHRGKSQIWT